MSKGEKLNAILDRADRIADERNELFAKNGFTVLDGYSCLSGEDRERFFELDKQSDAILQEIKTLFN